MRIGERGMVIHPGRWALVTFLLLAAAACGPVEPEAEPSTLRAQTQESQDDNGLSFNGLSFNGLSFNGLSFNGLSFNGLSAGAFHSWFQQNAARSDEVMRYVVRCALPAGQTRTYTHPLTGVTYAWTGALGLAPVWASGAPAPVLEQQLVSACLAAHINKFGKSVPISVLGRNAKETPLPFTPEELAMFSAKEACFFGNYFTGQGGLAGMDRALLSHRESSSRVCGLRSGRKYNEECPAVAHVGACQNFCTLDATGTYYTQCTYQGQSFIPLTTRIKPTEIFECGDGVCQFTESCGTGTTPDNCQADCGLCP